MLEKYIDIITSEFNQTVSKLNDQPYVMLRKLIKDSKKKNNRMHVTGVGKSSHVSSYAASLFSSIGYPTYYLDATEAVHGSSGQVCPGDIVFAISNSGATSELVQTIKVLKLNGAKIVGITKDENSKIAELSDVHFLAHVDNEGDNLNKPPRASIIAQIIIIQAISIILQEANQLTLEDYLKWHPSGTIGQQIKNELKK